MRPVRFAILASLVILSLIVVACAPQPNTVAEAPTVAPAAEQPAATEDLLKVGLMGPFSGPNARLGTEIKYAAQFAFDKVDWKIGSYKVEFVYIDSQSDPAKASQAYEQAVVQDHIQAGLLQWHSSTAVSCMEVAAKYKIPHFFGYGATELVNEKYHSDPGKYGYWIKGYPTPGKLIVPYVQGIEDAISHGVWKPESKTLAIYNEDTDLGRSFGKALREQFTAVGWEVVMEEYFPLDQSDFYPLINKMKSINPALVAGTLSTAPTAAAFIKQADEIGLKSLIITDGLGWIGEWYNLVGKSSDYVIDQIPGWTTESGKAFAKEFEEKYDMQAGAAVAGLSYDSSTMFIRMLEKVYEDYGKLDSETIYKWSQENLITGKWSFTDGIVMQEYAYNAESVPDQIVGEGYFIFPVLQYFDGVGKVFYPTQWREQDLKPKP